MYIYVLFSFIYTCIRSLIKTNKLSNLFHSTLVAKMNIYNYTINCYDLMKTYSISSEIKIYLINFCVISNINAII